MSADLSLAEPPRRRRLRDLPIAAKLGLVAGAFGVIIVALVLLLMGALDIIAGVRGYVAAEIVAVTGLLLLLALLVTWRVAAELRGAVLRLQTGALKFSAGDPDVRFASGSRDELGQLAGVFDAMVRHRQDAERALRAATEMNEAIMQNATDAIFVVDRDRRLSMVNRRTCELSGYSREELLSLPWSALLAPEQGLRMAEMFDAVMRNGATFTDQEVPLLRRDGSVRTLRFGAAPLRRDGEVFALVGSAEDITERRRAEAELAASAAELARSNRELEQFAYIASQDLQEPLRAIGSFADLLSRRYQGRLDGEADSFIEAIDDNVRMMRSLVEDLLAYARVGYDPRNLEAAPLDDVYADACATLSAAIDASRAELSCAPLPTLRVNRAQIRLLLEHLIGNALKFQGAGPPRVRIGAQQQGSEWLFAVADQGIGIDPQHAERIFVLFQRLHPRSDYPGNGIGLTLCKKIVELHGGRIWHEPGNPGAVFKFTLKTEI